MLVFSTVSRVRAVILISLLQFQGNAQTEQSISLSVHPTDVITGEAVCPGTTVYFNCTAEGVVFLRWLRNGTEIKVYISQDDAVIQQTIGAYTLILNYSTPAAQGLRNLTSTLVGTIGTGFQNGDQIECLDDSGQSRTLRFIQISAPPAPTGFRKIVTANGSLSFGFISGASFNAANNVNEYRLVANDSSVMCQQGCSSEGRCQCSGFTDGVNVSVNVSAVSCGDLEGSAVEIRVAPQAPMEYIMCTSHPVYSYTGGLIMLQIAWDKAQDLPNITSGVSQNVMKYSVSVSDDSSNVTAANACLSRECSFSYSMPSSSIPTGSNVAVTVTAFNIVGGGPKSTCTLLPTMNISQTNEIFSLLLSTTDPNNRTVECSQLYQGSATFRCEFCLELDQRTCFNLSDNSMANAALDLLGEGSYQYEAIAYLNDDPVASIYDNFSTFCQPGELGIMEMNQTNPLNNLNSGSIQNGFVRYNGTVAGSLATYKCDNGYTLSGSDRRVCRSDGRWNESTPSCNEIVVPQTEYARWTIALVVLTALWIVSFVTITIIRSVLICKLVSQPCTVSRSCILTWCSFIWEAILLLTILILWGVFFHNPVGYSEMISLVFSFVLSVLLVIESLIITVVIITYYHCNSKEKSFEPDPPDKHRSDKLKEAPAVTQIVL